MVTLETERLILRPWAIEDVEDLFEYAKDPDVGPNAGWKPHENREESLNIVKIFMEKNEVWAIVYKKNNKVIGSLGLHNDKGRCVPSKMVGYVLSKDYWGQGIMTEAVNGALKYAFEELKLDLVSCYHFHFNMRSKRVIEKCKFKFEGVLRQAIKRYDGMICDDYCYSITKDEYYEIDK